MPGGLTLLASLDTDIPTPAAGKVTVFFSLDTPGPSYKDDTGTVSPLGVTGASGSAGATGPAGPMSLFLEDSINGEDGIPGPPGINGAAGGASGSLIGKQVITTPGAYTYTPTVGTILVVIELLGGGGGGGGSAQPTGSNTTAGGGGGAGAWLTKRLTASFSGGTGVIGAGGTGGAAGNNAGIVGGDTTFIDSSGSPVTYTAAGGALGAGGPNGVATPCMRPITPAAGGIATNGDINENGGAAKPCFALAVTQILPAQGGISKYGKPSGTVVATGANITQAGTNATGKGAGGNGAICGQIGAAAAGGNGTDGMAIFWEFA